jgi:hypothetical protein
MGKPKDCGWSDHAAKILNVLIKEIHLHLEMSIVRGSAVFVFKMITDNSYSTLGRANSFINVNQQSI